MEWVEITGKTLEEAKDLALDQLRVDEADAEFEVISEPKVGLFGRIKVEARIRARVRPAQLRPKDEGGRRRSSSSSSSSSRSRNDVTSTRTPATSATSSGNERPAPSSGNERPSNTSSSRLSSAEPASSESSRRRQKPTSKDGGTTVETEVPLSEQQEVAEDFLDGLFACLQQPITLNAQIHDDNDETLAFAIDGANLGHLIGPRGVTLHALQEVTRTVVQRKTGARNGRITVDINSYREKRQEALQRFAHKVAEEVQSTGIPRSLEAMNSVDRKVVHDALTDVSGVTTVSEGEDPRRWVVIKPQAE